MGQERAVQEEIRYRHMNANSLKELMEKMNRRVVLHLFADSMQPDLLFREAQTCVAASGDLQYALIEGEVLKAFNRCANVEEAEALRDKLADNLERMVDYLSSKDHQRRMVLSSGAGQSQSEETEKAIAQLFDRLHSLLFSENEIQPEPEWSVRSSSAKRSPKESPEPNMDWIRYEKKLDEPQIQAAPAQEPAQIQVPPMAQSSPPPLNPAGNHSGYVSISETGMMSVVTILSLAMIVFGSISALSTILSLHSASLLTSMIYGCLWALCIVNLVFLFVYYAGRLLHVPVADSADPSASVFEKYSIVFWFDLVLAWVLILTLWFYMIRKAVDTTWILQAFERMPSLFLVLGTLLLLYLLYRSFLWLRHQTYGADDPYRSTRDEMDGFSHSLKRSMRRAFHTWKIRRRKKKARKELEKLQKKSPRPAAKSQEDEDHPTVEDEFLN